MAKELQIRRGTTQANDLFIGKEGELSMDTTTKGLRIHDGQTAGGFKIDTVVDFQVPTSSNNYTWYRKYSSGWVEQGGIVTKTAGAQVAISITLPVIMNNASYYANAIYASGAGDSTIDIGLGLTASVLKLYPAWGTTGTYILWEVKGIAA